MTSMIKSLQTVMGDGLFKGAKTWKLEFCEHYLIGKKTIVKFGNVNHNVCENLKYIHKLLHFNNMGEYTSNSFL